MGLSNIEAKETARAGTILAPRDLVEELAESGSVYVSRRQHLRVIEKRAEGSA